MVLEPNSGDLQPGDLQPGDIVRLKKRHPCGGYLWRVDRIDGDVGLRCETCGRSISAPLFRFSKRIREVTRPAAEPDGQSAR